MNDTRPTTDLTWTAVAVAASKRSRCDRAKVGAVIVAADGRVAATGYNGPPADWAPATGTCSNWCKRNDWSGEQDFSNCPAVHAELNALLYCDRDQARGGTLYVTKSPCMGCCKAIAAAGIKRVVWPVAGRREDEERGRVAAEFLAQCGITVAEPERTYG